MRRGHWRLHVRWAGDPPRLVKQVRRYAGGRMIDVEDARDTRRSHYFSALGRAVW